MKCARTNNLEKIRSEKVVQRLVEMANRIYVRQRRIRLLRVRCLFKRVLDGAAVYAAARRVIRFQIRPHSLFEVSNPGVAREQESLCDILLGRPLLLANQGDDLAGSQKVVACRRVGFVE